MTLTFVPSAQRLRSPRAGIWVEISMSLIVTGLITLGTAIGIGVHWYTSLDILRTDGATPSASVSMSAGGTHIIDELVATNPGYNYLVDVRSVSVRVGANTADATVKVMTCEAGGGSPGAFALVGGATCLTPVDFHAGAMNLASERLLVQVRARRPGTVVIDGITVSYRSGIRHASQDVGPKVTIAVRA